MPTVTVGTNSYISVTDANTYFGERYGGDAWTSLSSTLKEQALITATRKIDRLPIRGRKYLDSEFQPLAFPRDFDEDGIVHERVKQACCEEAFALTKTELQKRKELQQQGVKSFSLGKLSESYQGNSFSGNSLLSLEAIDLLNSWLMGAVKIV